MDEQAQFEARAVLAPMGGRRTRLAVLVPLVALVVTAWAGLSGPRSEPVTVAASTAVAIAPPLAAEGATPVVSDAPPSQVPERVIGFEVHRLADLRPERLGRDELVAIAGWYIATSITDCPPLAAIYLKDSVPGVRGEADSWAWCDRFGVFYASRPDLRERVPTNNLEDNRSKSAGLPAFATTLVHGVVVPPNLEIVGGDATEVVVVGRFVDSGDGCGVAAGCRGELLVDYVAWTPSA